jgi:hypothetical protein
MFRNIFSQFSPFLQFLLDVISGEATNKYNPAMVASDLFSCWEEKSGKVQTIPSEEEEEEPSQDPSINYSIDINDSETQSLLAHTSATGPTAVPTTTYTGLGSWWHFPLSFIICFCFPFACPISLYHQKNSLRFHYGGLLGASCMFCGLFAFMIWWYIYISNGTYLAILMSVIDFGGLTLIGASFIIILVIRYGSFLY